MQGTNPLSNQKLVNKGIVFFGECLRSEGSVSYTHLDVYKRQGEGNRTTNSLYARHFIEDNHKFVNPSEDYEIVKVVNNTVERELKEELEILKEREKGLQNLINTKTKFDN